jgi:hypothetical protein
MPTSPGATYVGAWNAPPPNSAGDTIAISYAAIPPGKAVTLDAIVQEVNATYKKLVGAKNMVASHAEKICSGTANGWYLENKLVVGTMSVVLEQTILLGESRAFVATYARLDTDKEDPGARGSLDTLCIKGFERPTGASTDGEGTVYLTNDFAGDFDLLYDATLAPAPSNHSWSLVGVMLKAQTTPAWMEIGLSRGDPDAATLTAFTAASTSTGKRSWNPVKAECAPSCEIELRGDKTTVDGFVNGRQVEEWSRVAFQMVKPYVQLNAEVNAVGDIISARLTLRHGTVSGAPLQPPTCAFTTQGVEAKLLSPTVLTFSGQLRTDARVTYVSLVDGTSEDHCPDS